MKFTLKQIIRINAVPILQIALLHQANIEKEENLKRGKLKSINGIIHVPDAV